jgi:tetratricopeptide (TPR) repeat protein
MSVLAIREARLGAGHPYTAQSLSNLALVLSTQGDLDGARRLHERALAIRETRLGADHPDTAQSLNNLAAVLRDQGDLDGARRLLQQALAIFEARLGPDHPTRCKAGRTLRRSPRRWRIGYSCLTVYGTVVPFWRHPFTLAF